jgi:hypothetical protein
MKLEDVSFLALQGSYDSDEASFHGLRQFRRIEFPGSDYHFKAGLYLHRANHGQFNTVWGRRDAGPPHAWLLNLAPLIDGETQRRVALVSIAAFLEATLHEKLSYVPLFRDPRVGREWFPDVTLVAQFSDSRTTPIATFEEDLDVSTATLEGARVEAEGLSLWREEELLFRDDQKQGTSAVVLGWSPGSQASWTLRFRPEGEAFDSTSRLVFFMGASTERPDPEEAPESTPPAREIPRIEIEIEDLAGESSRFELSDRKPIAMPLEVQFLKTAWLNREAHGRTWEPTLSSYDIPLELFVLRNERLDLARLAAVRFVLTSEKGSVVVLDDVAVARSAFTAVQDGQGNDRPEGDER